MLSFKLKVLIIEEAGEKYGVAKNPTLEYG